MFVMLSINNLFKILNSSLFPHFETKQMFIHQCFFHPVISGYAFIKMFFHSKITSLFCSDLPLNGSGSHLQFTNFNVVFHSACSPAWCLQALLSHERALRDLTYVYNKYLMGGSREDEAGPCSVVPSKRTRTSGTNWNIWEKILYCEDGQTLNKLPREVVEPPALQKHKHGLDTGLSNLLWSHGPAWPEGWIR